MAEKPQTPNAPTQNRSNKRPKKVSEYGQQLQEKQKVRNSYGMRETQFRNYYAQASKVRGQTGVTLLQILERRLDNAIFRAGFARTRAQARQLASHRHLTLNGVRVSIPSIMVKKGDVIAFYKEREVEISPETPKCEWMKVEPKKGKATVERIPEGSDLPIEFDTQKIVEFYSK